MKNSQLTGRMVAPCRLVSRHLVSRQQTPRVRALRASRSLLLSLPVLVGLSSLVGAHAGRCQLFNNIPTGAYKMDTAAFVKDLDARLKGHCVGFAYVVSYKSDLCTMSAGGEARRAQDQPARAMTMLDKFNIASLSKTITATAAMKALHDVGVSLDSKMYVYLPPNWQPSPNVKLITFRQLLTHTSGILTPLDVDYASIKKTVESGVQTKDMGKYSYNNTNFALFRFLIPRLAGMTIDDSNAASSYAQAYMTYVQKNIFNKMALYNASCAPVGDAPALCYQFPKTNAPGADFGDMTLTNASRGWHLSAANLNMFSRLLNYTDTFVPHSLAVQMQSGLLGYDFANKTSKGFSYYGKGGYYPGKQADGTPFNPGEFNGFIVGFDNDVQIALVVNSQLGPGTNPVSEIAAAFDDSLSLTPLLKKPPFQTTPGVRASPGVRTMPPVRGRLRL